MMDTTNEYLAKLVSLRVITIEEALQIRDLREARARERLEQLRQCR